LNILFIGPYRQGGDGWCQASKGYIKALATTKHNLTIRPIYMCNTSNNEIDPLFLELEANKQTHYDIIIQNVLPNLLDPKTAGSRTINLCMFETGNLQDTPWPYHINLTDELWMASPHDRTTAVASGVTIPVRHVPIPVDTKKFEHSYNIDGWKQIDIENNFNFYFVGEYIPRKNLQALLTAFHREFRPTEPVNLIIKTNKGGVPSKQLGEIANKDFTQIKTDLALYQSISAYKSEFLVTDFLSEHDLYALHQACDCFVMPSRGEACCQPMLDAIGFGNPVIVTGCTGMADYITKDVGWIVDSTKQPVYSTEHPLPYLYTGRETWREIDVFALQRAMREAFEIGTLQKLQKLQQQQKCREYINGFSYQCIGNMINELLKSEAIA